MEFSTRERTQTLALKEAISSSVKVSAFAIMGIKLTLVWSRRMNSISIGRKLENASRLVRVILRSRRD